MHYNWPLAHDQLHSLHILLHQFFWPECALLLVHISVQYTVQCEPKIWSTEPNPNDPRI